LFSHKKSCIAKESHEDGFIDMPKIFDEWDIFKDDDDNHVLFDNARGDLGCIDFDENKGLNIEMEKPVGTSQDHTPSAWMSPNERRRQKLIDDLSHRVPLSKIVSFAKIRSALTQLTPECRPNWVVGSLMTKSSQDCLQRVFTHQCCAHCLKSGHLFSPDYAQGLVSYCSYGPTRESNLTATGVGSCMDKNWPMLQNILPKLSKYHMYAKK